MKKPLKEKDFLENAEKEKKELAESYKESNYIDAYINYYVNAKKHFAKYTNRDVPEFMQ